MEPIDLEGEFQSAQSGQNSALVPPTVGEYREYLDEFPITEEQKAELLATLWWIVVSFVDMGFGIDSVQRCLPALEEMTMTPAQNELERTQARKADGECTDGKECTDEHAR